MSDYMNPGPIKIPMGTRVIVKTCKPGDFPEGDLDRFVGRLGFVTGAHPTGVYVKLDGSPVGVFGRHFPVQALRRVHPLEELAMVVS